MMMMMMTMMTSKLSMYLSSKMY